MKVASRQSAYSLKFYYSYFSTFFFRNICPTGPRGKRNISDDLSGGLLGYALFGLDNKLEKTIAEWFKLRLDAL